MIYLTEFDLSFEIVLIVFMFFANILFLFFLADVERY